MGAPWTPPIEGGFGDDKNMRVVLSSLSKHITNKYAGLGTDQTFVGSNIFSGALTASGTTTLSGALNASGTTTLSGAVNASGVEIGRAHV